MTTPLPPFGVTQQMTRCETFHINIWSCCCRQGKGSGRRLPPALLSGPGSEGADRGPRPRAAPWLVPLSAPSPRPEDCRLLSLTCPLPPNPSAVCGILNKYNFHIAEVRLQNPARGRRNATLHLGGLWLFLACFSLLDLFGILYFNLL